LEDESLYTIGKLSKRVGLSVAALRYYDDINLFSPAHTDPLTGYRYYTLTQAQELARILELKSYGFSLREIKTLRTDHELPLANIYQNRYWDLLKEREQLQAAIDKLAVKIKNQQEVENMRKRILIADDAAFMRVIVRDVLTKNGYKVAGEAVDGNDAVEMYKKHSPDLVLLNITMPGMDGISALHMIKKYDANAKVVMLSACGQPKFITESFLAGAQQFIVKPFQAERMLQAVQEVVQEDADFNLAVFNQIWHLCNEDMYVLSQGEIDEITALAKEETAFTNDLTEQQVLELLAKKDDTPLNAAANRINAVIEKIKGTRLTPAAPLLSGSSASSPADSEVVALLKKIAAGHEDIKKLLMESLKK
jgi:two-component system chemotaxis response regulator CheY